MHIVSIVPINKQGPWAVTLTINAGESHAITAPISAERDSRVAIVRAISLFYGLKKAHHENARIAVAEPGINAATWDALYADGWKAPSAILTDKVPQGALDTITLIGGSR